MYQVGGWLDFFRGRTAPSGQALRRAVPLNVIFLGVTSLLTDVSSEMVVSILPLYLVSFLHLTPMQFGLVDGLYQGVGGVVQLGAAVVTDRLRWHKEIAGLGYVVSAGCRLGLLFTTAWTGITGILALDRLGKGMRTAPRDALISLSVDRQNLGVAFGVHRAMDATGAMLGPISAFVVLQMIPNGFDVIFVLSACAAILGVAFFVFFVENRSPESAVDEPRPATRLSDVLALLQQPAFRHLAVCALLLGSMTISDAFVYLTLQREGHVPTGAFPLLFVLTSACYLLFAVPIGRLADRAGRFRVFLAGHALLLGLYASLIGFVPGSWLLVTTLTLLGVYYAATEGVLMALGSALLPGNLRTSGLALLTTALSVARFTGSLLFGVCWGEFGLRPTVLVFLVGLSGAIAIALATRPRSAPQ